MARLGAGLVAIGLGGVGPALAAEWYAEAALNQRFQYDDNIGLNLNGEASDFSSNSFVRGDLGGRTEALDLSLGTRLDFTRFFDETQLDSDDQRVVLDGAYRTALGRWGLNAAFDRDTTRTSDEDDTGRFILDNVRRLAFEVRPSWTYDVTDTDKVTATGEFSDVDFDRRLVDYRRYEGELGWAHQLTPVNAIDLAAFASRTDPDTRIPRTTDVYGLKAGWTTEPLRDLELRIGAGGYWAETDLDPAPGQAPASGDDGSFGFLPEVSAVYRIDQNSTIEGAYSRSVAPSGSGNVLERDTVDASVVHNWSPRGTVALNFRFRTQESLVENRDDERDFIRIKPSIVWRLTESWSVEGAYRFRYQAFDTEDDSAMSNAVMVTVSFRPLKWATIAR